MPDVFVMHQEGRHLRYSEFHTRATRLANGLAGLGVARGDRVALLARNSIEMAEVFVGAVMIGAIAAPLSFRLASDEITHILSDLEPAAVIVENQFCQMVNDQSAIRSLAPHWLVFGEAPDGVSDFRQADPFISYEALVEGSVPEPLNVTAVADTDTAYILYTSGTTGRPKGAMLSHVAPTRHSPLSRQFLY